MVDEKSHLDSEWTPIVDSRLDSRDGVLFEITL